MTTNDYPALLTTASSLSELASNSMINAFFQILIPLFYADYSQINSRIF